MNSKVKRTLMRVGGFLTYVGLPVIPTAMQWGVLMNTDAKTTISSSVLLVIIACLPVLKYVVKTDKIPADVNKIWAVIFVFSVLFMYIAEQMIWISGAGVAGSVIGSALFKYADKQAAEEKNLEVQTKALQQAQANINSSKT